MLVFLKFDCVPVFLELFYMIMKILEYKILSLKDKNGREILMHKSSGLLPLLTSLRLSLSLSLAQGRQALAGTQTYLRDLKNPTRDIFSCVNACECLHLQWMMNYECYPGTRAPAYNNCQRWAAKCRTVWKPRTDYTPADYRDMAPPPIVRGVFYGYDGLGEYLNWNIKMMLQIVISPSANLQPSQKLKIFSNTSDL